MTPDAKPGAARRLVDRVLPAPGLSAVLLLAWLMLNQSATAGHALLGAALGLALPLLTQGRSSSHRVHSIPAVDRRGGLRVWPVAVRLAAVVLLDIVRANVDVARRVLGPEAALLPRFVWVPLALRSPQGVAALAGIVTLTPGTVSSQISADHRHLLVHALHCPDEAALVAEIKSRYEAPLLELLG